MKKYKLGIIGGFIIVLFLGIITIVNVKAEPNDYNTQRPSINDPTCEKDKKDIPAECKTPAEMIDTATVKYGAKIKIEEDPDDEENNKYYISLSAKDPNLKNVTFTVTKIGTRNITNGIKIKSGEKKEITVHESDFQETAEEPYADTHKVLRVELDTCGDPECGHLILAPEFMHPKGNLDNQTEEEVNYNLPMAATNHIDCTKEQTNNISKAFCDIKSKATEKTVTINEDGRMNITEKLQCDTNPFPGTGENLDKVMLGDASNDNDKYYKGDYYLERNRKYFKGSTTKTLTVKDGLTPYEYHFIPGAPTDTINPSCEVTCEEVVAVEYGAPVASHAGLCFEYKVKVTSIVNCNMSKPPTKYKAYKGYCTPTPVCTNGYAYFTQGGPNEDFEQCINDCDGGKYTQKCSKTCYNQVYNKKTSKNKELKVETYKDISPILLNTVSDGIVNFSLSECTANTLKNPEKYGENGCYYRKNGKANGKILFKQNVDKGDWGGPAGRWYAEGNGKKDYSAYDADRNGIYRRDKGNTHCQDTCWWTGCKGKYLNPGYAEADTAKNKKAFETNVGICQAAASCSTTTSEFKIEVDYTNKETNEKVTVKYPYASSNGDRKIDTLNSKHKENITNTLGDGHTILNYAGCYNMNQAKNWYQTEWSFPGTWRSSKTGEISFKPINSPGWYKKKDKFCIPLNAQSVNVNWWNWYMKKSSSPNSSYSYFQEKYTDTCGTGIKNATKPTKNQIKDWNIRAYIAEFGYFGWNFDISCFYALNNNPGTTTTQEKTPDECKPGLEYKVRIVDNNNLFPSKEGAETNTSIETNKTGRTPGFNWTKEATISHSKNDVYAINPSALIGNIQKVGNSIYKESNESKYLDYHFKLTPEVLREIKKYNNQNGNTRSYYSLEGNFERINGVRAYKSDLLHGEILRNAKLKVGNIGCNNDDIGSQCETFDLGE